MRAGAPLLLLALTCALALGQTPGLGGTWQLDAERSSVSSEAPLAGLIGAGAPGVLHITQPANGTLVVESQENESHSRLYVPGASSTTPIFLGEAGTITMTTSWEGGTLVSQGTRQAASSETAVKETFALTDGGRTLAIEITAAESTSTLRYTRIDDVGPCESWPSPCKDFSSLERR